MTKPIVFISHITEEKEIAASMKSLVESTFLNMIEVFVSSESTSIRAGQRWIDEITHALKNCKVEIILVSPESLRRPWINFEGGCGWIRDIPVIPLCHSGMLPDKLPPPLGALQAALASTQAGLEKVFPVLADAVGCTLPKSIDYQSFITTVLRYEENSKEIEAVRDRSSTAAGDLTDSEVAVLTEASMRLLSSDDKVEIQELRNAIFGFGWQGRDVVLATGMLARRDYVETFRANDEAGNQLQFLRILTNGWRWLEQHSDVETPRKKGGRKTTKPLKTNSNAAYSSQSLESIIKTGPTLVDFNSESRLARVKPISLVNEPDWEKIEYQGSYKHEKKEDGGFIKPETPDQVYPDKDCPDWSAIFRSNDDPGRVYFVHARLKISGKWTPWGKTIRILQPKETTNK